MTNVFIDFENIDRSVTTGHTFSTVVISDVAPNIASKFKGNEVQVGIPTFDGGGLQAGIDSVKSQVAASGLSNGFLALLALAGVAIAGVYFRKDIAKAVKRIKL